MPRDENFIYGEERLNHPLIADRRANRVNFAKTICILFIVAVVVFLIATGCLIGFLKVRDSKIVRC